MLNPNKGNEDNENSSNGGAPLKRNSNAKDDLNYSQSNHQTPNYDRNQFIWNRSGSVINHRSNSQNFNKDEQSKDSEENSLLDRFRSLASGAYKYNPFLINQVRNLDTGNGEITDSDIYSLFKKQNFSGNEYLNSLQKGSNYFRFQYFNPLNASKYYENLDEQVLALITGEIGSMPDLKKPNDKDKGSRSAFKNHSADEITTNDNEQSDDYNKNKKLDRVLITLGSAIVAIFAGVVGMFIYNRRKNQQ